MALNFPCDTILFPFLAITMPLNSKQIPFQCYLFSINPNYIHELACSPVLGIDIVLQKQFSALYKNKIIYIIYKYLQSSTTELSLLSIYFKYSFYLKVCSKYLSYWKIKIYLKLAKWNFHIPIFHYFANATCKIKYSCHTPVWVCYFLFCLTKVINTQMREQQC